MESRTTNSLKNISYASIFQFISLIVSFISRTYFIKLLNADYLGINGLFTNVLTLLSFSELGIGSAIIFNMYRPVREGNIDKLSALQKLYSKAYRIIALFILLAGLCLSPFIHKIINGIPDIKENITCIYILFLLDTVFSYIFSYRKSIFTANQKEYVNLIIERTVFVLRSILQLIYIYITHDYYGYLVIAIISTLLVNLIIYIKAGKKYSIIYNNKSTLTRSEIKSIFNDIYSIFCYKLGSVVMKASGSLIITKLINVTILGICSNYTLIISTIETLLSKSLNSIVASIGNLNSSPDEKSKLNVMRELTFIVNWIYGFIAICITLLLNDIIQIWLGNSYNMDNWWVVISMAASFYVFGTNFVASNYRVTMGFFRKVQFVPLMAAVINIVLAIVLGKQFGVAGVYFAIVIARVITFGIIDPIIVLRKGLSSSARGYFKFQLLFLIITIGNGLICYFVATLIDATNIGGLIIKAAVIVALSNAIYLIFFNRTELFKKILTRFLRLKR